MSTVELVFFYQYTEISSILLVLVFCRKTLELLLQKLKDKGLTF